MVENIGLEPTMGSKRADLQSAAVATVPSNIKSTHSPIQRSIKLQLYRLCLCLKYIISQSVCQEL